MKDPTKPCLLGMVFVFNTTMRYKLLIFFLFISFLSNAQEGLNLVSLGNESMNLGNYRKAQEYYQAALSTDKFNWNIYTLLAFSIHKQKRFKEADSLYRISLSNDTNNSKTYWYKAMNHIALKQDSIAIVLYKKFIDIEKFREHSVTQAYRSVGQCYERMLRRDGLYAWQIDDMIYHYDQIEKLDPSGVEVPLIRNFIELVNSKRPANQVGKWKMEP